ncbi:hypothetical protein BC831DRAFT_492695 [Entophlyctis helioformis]|nr:hypothetical protein BC831DRAFT_492695 [Entophlyctis helioformis]
MSSIAAACDPPAALDWPDTGIALGNTDPLQLCDILGLLIPFHGILFIALLSGKRTFTSLTFLPQAASIALFAAQILVTAQTRYDAREYYWSFAACAWLCDVAVRMLLLYFMYTRLNVIYGSSGLGTASGGPSVQVPWIVSVTAAVYQTAGLVFVVVCDLGRLSTARATVEFCVRNMKFANIIYDSADFIVLVLDSMVFHRIWTAKRVMVMSTGSQVLAKQAGACIVLSGLMLFSSNLLFTLNLDPDWIYYTVCFTGRILFVEILNGIVVQIMKPTRGSVFEDEDKDRYADGGDQRQGRLDDRISSRAIKSLKGIKGLIRLPSVAKKSAMSPDGAVVRSSLAKRSAHSTSFMVGRSHSVQGHSRPFPPAASTPVPNGQLSNQPSLHLSCNDNDGEQDADEYIEPSLGHYSAPRGSTVSVHDPPPSLPANARLSPCNEDDEIGIPVHG